MLHAVFVPMVTTKAEGSGLGLSLALNYLLPLKVLLALESPAREISAALLIAAPVFFAAICFSRLFSRESQTGYALGINLVGAMGGGLLEYFSMLTGMRNIWLIALLIYFMAWITTRRSQNAADPC